jgi:hypothetical protein
MLVLTRWLWAGHRRLRLALLGTHGFVLLLGSLYIGIGFLAVAAAERSTARGGGLLSPIAYLPFVHGVPLTIFALCSIVFALALPPTINGGCRSGRSIIRPLLPVRKGQDLLKRERS